MVRDIEGSAGVLDIHQMLPRLHDVLSSMIPYDAMAFFVRQGNALRVEYATGANRVVLSQLDVSLGEGLTGWVARNRQPVVNGNPAVDPGFWCEGQSELNSVLSVPVDGEHELIGVLNLYRREKESFTRDDLRVLNAVTPQAALALANSIKYRDVQRMAKIDPVTNLPNADLFMEGVEEELATSRRLGQPFTVLILEMEEYQHVLVRNGKPHTDEILATLSRELQRTCRPQDQVARLGPATFGLAFPGMNQQELAVKLERIEQFAKGNRGSFGDLTLFSYGGALFPDDGDTASQLLMIGRRRAQPSGAEWLASIRALANSVGEAVAPVETPEHHPAA
jgi:diguanylate cyclase (GGDEF)-like protein